MRLLEEIALLPPDWALCACGGNKAPLGEDWVNRPLRLADFEAASLSGEFSDLVVKKKNGGAFKVPFSWVKAVGVLCGPISGGLMFFDHDGTSCDQWVVAASGADVHTALPKSPVVTSGRHGRYQIAYRVPTAFLGAIETRKFRTGVAGDDGKPEMAELRWTGCQSVVLGEHPITGGYRWKYHPSDLAIAEAPLWMIEKMLIDTAAPRDAKAPLAGLAVPLVECLSVNAKRALDGNFSEGRNDTAAKLLAPELLGTEEFLRAIGQPFEGSAEQIFFDWCDRVGLTQDKPKGQPDAIWRHAQKSRYTPSLSPEKIEGCIRAWERRQTPKRNTQKAFDATGTPIPENEGEMTDAERLRNAVGYFHREEDPFVRALLERSIQKDFSVYGRRLESLVSAISRPQADGFQDIDELSVEAFALLEKQGDRDGIGTGFLALDQILGPIEPGELCILAARPSMGKSCLAINVLINVAKNHGHCAFFSIEMSKKLVFDRMISPIARIPLSVLKTIHRRPEFIEKAVQAISMLNDLPVSIADPGLITLAEMRSHLVDLKQRKGDLKLVVIDYLQLLEGDGENRNVEITKLSRGLKILAKELDCAILCLSQLSRSVEQRGDKVPMMSDLRESGAIEQDADKVLFIYREEYYKADCDSRGRADIIIAKNRNGATGKARVGFAPEFQLFYEDTNRRLL